MTRGRVAFDREFGAIQTALVQMSQQVDSGVERAMKALHDRDIPLAEQVIMDDEQVNRLRFTIEEECLTLIATQQPAAGDLRSVVAAMHMAVDMERMADHAAGIAKTVLLMEEEPLLKTFKKIFKMGELSRQMLADIVQAFVNRDVIWAREIASRDQEMDELYRSVFDKLIATMGKKPELVARATYLLWCAHNLERIADRVTNLAERVIFMTTGDLRELNVFDIQNLPTPRTEPLEASEKGKKKAARSGK